METKNIFKFRVKELRNIHKLSMNDLAEMLDMKNGTGINQFEAGNSKPSMDMIIKYALLFGVSADWLLGLSSEPYTKDSIKAGKTAIEEKREFYKATDIIKETTEEFFKENKSRKTKQPKPSLNIEGNLIFLENATFLNDIKKGRTDAIKETALHFQPKSRKEQTTIRRNERYKNYLEYQLHGTDTPYYKLEKVNSEMTLLNPNEEAEE